MLVYQGKDVTSRHQLAITGIHRVIIALAVPSNDLFNGPKETKFILILLCDDDGDISEIAIAQNGFVGAKIEL